MSPSWGRLQVQMSYYDVCRVGGQVTTETVGTEVDYQVATLLKREHPTGTERQSLNKECGLKDGDRGSPAQTQNPWEEKEKPT
jgi:hypothetical protein